MGKLQELRQRIHSVEGIQVVTRTLATVAAAKLSRTRRRAAGLRQYARRVREMVLHQQLYSARTGLDLGDLSTLLRPRPPTGRIAVLIIAGDRGMCGGYNLEACRFALDFCEGLKAAGQRGPPAAQGQEGDRVFPPAEGRDPISGTMATGRRHGRGCGAMARAAAGPVPIR